MITRRIYGKKDPEPLRKFSSTQMNITGKPAAIMQKLAKGIPESDLGPDGREDEQHVTVKYGLHFQTPSARLRSALQAFGPVSLTLGKTSLFSNPDADVLKVDVDSPDLHRLNKLITKLLPTEDTHPTYTPHATIAYLKPGRGKKYAGDKALVGQKMTFDSLIFSGKKGHRETLSLEQPTPAAYRAR
jgi:2'-5' RNA ligase superfamily protein